MDNNINFKFEVGDTVCHYDEDEIHREGVIIDRWDMYTSNGFSDSDFHSSIYFVNNLRKQIGDDSELSSRRIVLTEKFNIIFPVH